MPDHLASPDHRDDAAASMARFALDGANDVLQLGSGPALPALYLAKEHGRHVTCAGSDRAALEAAESAGLPAIETDFDDETWDAALHGSSFDVVILAGILEEVRDPLGFLDRLLTAGLLRPEGILVVSVANATHASAVSDLLRGDVPAGSDRADQRVRRFNLARLQRLLERAGFLADRVDRITSPPEPAADAAMPDVVHRTLKELNAEADVHGYVVRALVDSSTTRLAVQRDEFESERRSWAAERSVLEGENTRLRADLERVSSLLREERAAFAAELEQGVVELTARDERIRRLSERRDKLVKERDRARSIVAASLYKESRGVRAAARVVRRLRALRGSRG